MSYVRFGKNSDVYVYGDVGGFISCCGCKLAKEHTAGPGASAKFYVARFLTSFVQLAEALIAIATLGFVHPSWSFTLILRWRWWSPPRYREDPKFGRYSDAIQHLREHRAAGHRVPQSAFNRLRLEMEDGDLFAPEYVEAVTPDADAWGEEED